MKSEKNFYILIISLSILIIASMLFMIIQKKDSPYSSEITEVTEITTKLEPVIKEKVKNIIPTQYYSGNLPKVEKIITTTLIFTGDIIPARTVNSIMNTMNDFTYPFASTSQFLKQADLTIINLEAPLTKDCPVQRTGMVFCGDQRFIDGIKKAGVDVVSLANNHIMNYGQDGLSQTLELFKRNNIEYTGVQNIAYKQVNSTTIAFLAFNGINPLHESLSLIEKETIKTEIAKAKKKADFVITMFHWGREYVAKPAISPGVADDDPTEIAHWAIDSGADLVVGNHPHIIQGYEKYKDKYIFYALGNFIFDQMWAEYTRLGYVLKLEMVEKKITGLSFYPVKIYDYIIPRFLEGAEKEKVLQSIVEYK